MVVTYPANGTADPAALLGPPVPSVDQILEMVDAHEQDMLPLATRMEGDHGLYRLNEHVNKDHRTGEILTNYAKYTSTSPRAFADKVISWLSMAQLLVRVPHLEALSHQGEVDNLKERFAIGCLRAADELLQRRGDPSLRDALSTFVTIRGGWLCGRALLVNHPRGYVYPDITAWDPMHAHWGVTSEGTSWAGYKIKKTLSQIRRDYPQADLSGIGGNGRDTSMDPDKAGVWCVDYYDSNFNVLIADGKPIKPPTLHGSPRVPAYRQLVGPMPILQSSTHQQSIADVGESVYGGVRKLYNSKNDVFSIMLQLVSRSRRQPIVTESADGRKTLPQDPWDEGTEIGLRTGEKVYPLEMQKMAQDTGVLLTAMLGEEQRITLPFSAYGETPFQLSGFAITQLRQATETVLTSRVAALEGVYRQVVELLYDQFMTGYFPAIRISGQDRNRQYFNNMLTPALLKASCDYDIALHSQLPEDDAGKVAMAETLKRNELMSDVDILDNVMKVQDSQAAIDKLNTQRAKRLLPEAALHDLMMSAAKQGDRTTARMYLMEYMRMMAAKFGMIPGQENPNPEGLTPGGDEGEGREMPPEVLPSAARGRAPEPETSNNGPAQVAPRTPRPRASKRNKER